MIISFKKQRFIDASEISLTGQISSIKNNSIIEFESSLERDFIYLLEYDVEIKYYLEQPIVIKYLVNDNERTYVPDFYIEYYNGKRELVEIKYKEDLIVNKDKYRDKFNATKELCIKNGLDFKILNEMDIRNHTLFNAKFLLYYRHPKISINRGDINLLMKTLNSVCRITISELINNTSLDKARSAELLYTVWYLVARNFVNYDKSRKLSMDTILWTKTIKE